MKIPLFFLILTSMTVHAGNAEKGQAKSAPCAICHGANGIGLAETYPNLAGQKQTYLVSAMKAYQDDTRTGGLTGLMKSMVTNLSDEDLADLAAYYSSIKQ